MLALKSSLFNNLKDPLSYIHTRGFRQGLFAPDCVQTFGKTVYFYNGPEEASIVTPESRVLASRVNQHETRSDHTLSILVSEDWTASVLDQLKDAMYMVYKDKESLPLSSANYDNEEDFWNACRKPFKNNVLTLEQPSYRSRSKTFVNMFDDLREITGTCALLRGGSVKVSIRFTVSEGDVVSDGFGLRARFGAGIRVVRTGGEIPKIKAPWNWTNVQFSDLTIPLRGPFHVKTPALTVVDIDGDEMSLDLERNEEFKMALHDFHHLARTDMNQKWVVHHTGRTIPQVGSTVIGTVEPSRNNNGITWHSRKVFVRPPRLEHVAAVEKRDEAIGAAGEVEEAKTSKRGSDTLGNFFGVRTKRRYN